MKSHYIPILPCKKSRISLDLTAASPNICRWYLNPPACLLTHLTVGVAASFIFRYFQPLCGEQKINRSQASWPGVNTKVRLDQWYEAENALHIHVVIIRIICLILWCESIVTEFIMTSLFKVWAQYQSQLSVSPEC